MNTHSLERTARSITVGSVPELGARAWAGPSDLAVENARLRARERAARRQAALYQAQLHEATRRNQEMLDILGDELRNPLAALVLCLAHMKARAPGPDWLCHALERHVDRLTALVNELLDAARATQGAVPLERESMEVDALVTDALAAVIPADAQPAAQIEVDVPRTGLVVEGDRLWLSRALTHVLDNALRFARPDCQGHIRIFAAADQGEAFIRVADDGAGVSPDRLNAIFEPFVQGFPPHARPPRGLGLGLTIVRRVVELHGGSVCATSPGAGDGFEIQIRLPLGPRHLTAMGPI